MNTATDRDLFALADACVACGLCLPHCPTYADARVESESPRGRIMIARALATGKLDASEAALGDAWAHCLGCRACETVCPADVEFGRLLLATRGRLREVRRPALAQRAVEWLLASPRRLRPALALARGLSRLPGLRNRLPSFRPAPSLRPSPGPAPRGRLLLLPGCVGSALERPALAVAHALLQQSGWEVVRGATARCCGSLHAHAGHGEGASSLRAALLAEIDRVAPDAVLFTASGCVESVRAAAGGRPVAELCAFLDREVDWAQIALRPLPRRVGLHVPCTQRHVVADGDAAARLLRRLPGIELLPAPDSGCCGAAGIQRLLFPAQAAQRVQPLLDWARRSELTVLCSSNIGCRLHLELSLAAGPIALPTRHPLELLAEAL